MIAAVTPWLDSLDSVVAVERPITLAIGLVIALALALAAARFEVMSRARRVLSALLRFALFAVILLCVCGVSLVRTSDRVATIVVLDSSDSVRRFGTLSAAPLLAPPLDALRAGVPRRADDTLGVVAFDGRAVSVLAPQPVVTHHPVPGRPPPAHAACRTPSI